MRAFCGDELLHERGGVEAELEASGVPGSCAIAAWSWGEAVEALDACAAAADVWLDYDGPAETYYCFFGLRCSMDDAGLRIGDV